MKVFKLEVLIIDEDIETKKEALQITKETKYPNHTLVFPIIVREKEVGK